MNPLGLPDCDQKVDPYFRLIRARTTWLPITGNRLYFHPWFGEATLHIKFESIMFQCRVELSLSPTEFTVREALTWRKYTFVTGLLRVKLTISVTSGVHIREAYLCSGTTFRSEQWSTNENSSNGTTLTEVHQHLVYVLVKMVTCIENYDH